MRCDRGDQPADHHTLLIVETGEVRLGHCAWEVADFDDLMAGHDHLLAARAPALLGHRPPRAGRAGLRLLEGPARLHRRALDRLRPAHARTRRPASTACSSRSTSGARRRRPTWTSDGPRDRGTARDRRRVERGARLRVCAVAGARRRARRDQRARPRNVSRHAATELRAAVDGRGADGRRRHRRPGDPRRAARPRAAEPDILVTNNGGPPPGRFQHWDRDEWIAAVDANMLAPLLLIRDVIDGMVERRFGRIVNITSAMVKAPHAADGTVVGRAHGLTSASQGPVARGRGRERHDQQPAARADRHRPPTPDGRARGRDQGHHDRRGVRGDRGHDRRGPARPPRGGRRRVRVPLQRAGRVHLRPEPAPRRRLLPGVCSDGARSTSTS